MLKFICVRAVMITLVIDSLSVFFTYLFLGIGIVVLLYSAYSVPTFTRWVGEFYAFVVWCTLGHMVLASAGELFTIFITLQLTSLPLVVLIGYAKRDPKSGEAALKYLLLVLVSTAVLVYGMSLVYGSLGTSTAGRSAAHAHLRTRIATRSSSSTCWSTWDATRRSISPSSRRSTGSAAPMP